MGWQPGPGSAAGEGPDRGPGGPPPARDPRLAQFASVDEIGRASCRERVFNWV